MSFKTFNEYINQFSSEFSNYSNRVGLATSESLNFPYFNYLKSHFDVNEMDSNYPIIIGEGFAFESSVINESFTYNLNTCPDFDQVSVDFKEKSFIPSEARSFNEVKKLKFPVTAYHKDGKEDFKTIGKLRGSDNIYNRFVEKIVPKTKFKVLSFKGNPISIIETVNKFPLDVDIKRFKYLNEVSKISNDLHSKYKIDFYNIEILESTKGGLYLNGVNKKMDLNPHQSFKVYEAAYEDFYNTRLPNWVKKKMIDESVSNYYKQKSYDSMLIRTDNTMDYSKLVKNGKI